MPTLGNNNGSHVGEHAVVMGGSMAGLLAARALSDHFDRVTLIERDRMHDRPESRKGQSQTRHPHALLATGLEIMTRFFPGLQDDLKRGGAVISDMGTAMRWHARGGYRVPFESGITLAMMSRPFLECLIRRGVVALANLSVRDGCNIEGLETSGNGERVTGVRITDRNAESGRDELTISADLILDATGRGTVTPKWLESLGFSRPSEDVVQVGVGYTSRIYRRQPGDLVGAELIFITANPPHDQRLGAMFPLEEDRWIVTLAGWAGDHAPADEAGFLEFARSLPVQDIAERIPKLEPLSDIFTYNLPSNLRRRYDRLTRFPEGYLVLGDALCSFNPVYGQGMTSAALQAAALDEMLCGRRSLQGFWKPYFERVAKIVNDPWSLAVSEDFLFSATKGKKPFGFGPISAYMAKVQLATHHDTVVYKAFLQVMNLASSPGSLFHPRILWRTLRPRKMS